MDLYEIVTLVIALIGVIAGTIYFGKFKTLIKELKEAFTVLDLAMEDDKITKEESKKVVKEFLDIVKIFKK